MAPIQETDATRKASNTQEASTTQETGGFSFAPSLTLKVVAPAIEFYKRAFGAVEQRRWSNPDGSVHVAEMSIGGALFHLHEEKAEKTWLRDPTAAGATTVTIGVFAPDAYALMDRALEAGARKISPMQDFDYGFRQGVIADPFGHYWMLQQRIKF